MLLSCTNCSFNGLQADGLGARFGYCTAHRRVLHEARSLTCGRLMRKDLLLPEARREREVHQRHFSTQRISLVHDPRAAADSAGLVDTDVTGLALDPVGRAVTDFATAHERGHAKPMFLAQLGQLARSGDARAELAQHSLGRTYVARCVERDGPAHWTSGIHLLQWTKELLPVEPVVKLDDLADAPVPHGRQRDLARWDMLMLRLTFLSDMGHLAPDDDPVAALRELPEQAARATGTVDYGALMTWIAGTAWKRVEGVFPTDRYAQLHAGLRRPTAYGARGRARTATKASEPTPGPLTIGGPRRKPRVKPT